MSSTGSGTEPLIICSRLPGEGYYHSLHYETRPILCRDDFDYWQGLADVWGSGRTILNVEHDMEVTDEHVAALLDCPYGACAWAYKCHWASTGGPEVVAAGRGVRELGNSGDPKYLQGGEHWAAWSAIGLIKLIPAVRIAPLRREPWQTLELAVHDAVERPWHIHWPEVPHWHY